MNLVKVLALLLLFVGSAAACEQSYQTEIESTFLKGNCKDLILVSMEEQGCSNSSMEEVINSSARLSHVGGATSVCFLETNNGHFTVVEDSISDTAGATVVYSMD